MIYDKILLRYEGVLQYELRRTWERTFKILAYPAEVLGAADIS